MAKRAVGVLLGLGALGGGLMASKRGDADVLANVGSVVASRVKAVIPEASWVSAPMAALKPGRVLPVEERVRVRIDSDKGMNGSTVTVVLGATAGEVKLRGVVATSVQRTRAAELAEGTVGVEVVVNEIAVPEQ